MKIALLLFLSLQSARAVDLPVAREKLGDWFSCSGEAKLKRLLCLQKLRKWAVASPANWRSLLVAAREEFDETSSRPILDMALFLRRSWVLLPENKRGCAQGGRALRRRCRRNLDYLIPVEEELDFLPSPSLEIFVQMGLISLGVQGVALGAGAGSYYLLQKRLKDVAWLAKRGILVRYTPVVVGGILVFAAVEYVVSPTLESAYRQTLINRPIIHLRELKNRGDAMGKEDQLRLLRGIVEDTFILAQIYDFQNRSSAPEERVQTEKLVRGILRKVESLSIPESPLYTKVLQDFLNHLSRRGSQ